MTKRRGEAYEKQRAARIFRTYGITLEEYEAIKEAQGGVCYLCQRAKGISAPLQVDHDHALSGRESVRGLLCGRCNNRLGGQRRGWIASWRTSQAHRQGRC